MNERTSVEIGPNLGSLDPERNSLATDAWAAASRIMEQFPSLEPVPGCWRRSEYLVVTEDTGRFLGLEAQMLAPGEHLEPLGGGFADLDLDRYRVGFTLVTEGEADRVTVSDTGFIAADHQDLEGLPTISGLGPEELLERMLRLIETGDPREPS